MKFSKFQKQVSKIVSESVVSGALFICEEAGEVAKEANRGIRNSDLASKNALAEELADVLVALASVANAADFDLDEIAQLGVDKWADK